MCDACTIAATDPRTGHFGNGCKECAARALAGGPDHWESAKAGEITLGYRKALDAAFGNAWEAGHKAVKEWAEKIDKHNKTKVTNK